MLVFPALIAPLEVSFGIALVLRFFFFFNSSSKGLKRHCLFMLIAFVSTNPHIYNEFLGCIPSPTRHFFHTVITGTSWALVETMIKARSLTPTC